MIFLHRQRSCLNRLVLRWKSSFRNLRGDPHYIALGMAVGVFISMTPFFPFQTAIALACASLVKGSRRGAAIGVWVSNPVTMPFFYYLSYRIGIVLLGRSVQFSPGNRSLAEIMKAGVDVTVAMLLGGLLLGAFMGVPAYAFTRRLVCIRQNARKGAR